MDNIQLYSAFIFEQKSGKLDEARNIMENIIAEGRQVMQPFAKSDYDGFAGVETKNPMIGHNSWGTVVHDGKHVEVHHMDGDNYDTMKAHGADFEHPGHASVMAHTMLNSKTRPSHEDFTNLGFEKLIG
jgi:hypothetical protein